MDTFETAKSWNEINNADRISSVIIDDRFKYCRVTNILRLIPCGRAKGDLAKALLFLPRQKVGKKRVSVKSRKTQPPNATSLIDERRNASISNGRKL